MLREPEIIVTNDEVFDELALKILLNYVARLEREENKNEE